MNKPKNRTKQLNKDVPTHILAKLYTCPNFHRTGSIIGMKKMYYGMDSLLVKSGSYIYNVSAYPDIWSKHSH